MSVNNIGQIVALGTIGVVSIGTVLVGVFYPEIFAEDFKLFSSGDTIAPQLVEYDATTTNDATTNDDATTIVTTTIVTTTNKENTNITMDDDIEPILEEVTILLDDSLQDKKSSKNKTKSKSKKEEKSGTSMKKHKKHHKEKILINPALQIEAEPEPI